MRKLRALRYLGRLFEILLLVQNYAHEIGTVETMLRAKRDGEIVCTIGSFAFDVRASSLLRAGRPIFRLAAKFR